MRLRGAHATLCVLVAACVAFPASAGAVTFDVATEADLPDSDPGNGVCATGISVAGPCSLRAAISEANEATGDRAIINIPAGTYLLDLTGAGEEENETGDLDIHRGVILRGVGARTTTIDGNGTDGVIHVHPDAAFVDISGLTITNGFRPFVTPPFPGGGGLANFGEQTLIADSAIIDNEVGGSQVGAGVYNGAAQGSGRPIGLRLERVLVADHLGATNPGAGLYNAGRIEVVNSTFRGNQIRLGSDSGGAAITNQTDVNGLISIDSTTFRDNAVSSTNPDTSTDFHHTPVTGGQSPIIVRSIFGDLLACNPSGGPHSGGNNIEVANTCGFTSHGDRPNTDPQLGAFADYGGPTNSYLPARTSPAVDGVVTGNCLALDQRGIARPFPASGTCDIGAVELVYELAQPPPPPPPDPVPSALALTPTSASRTPGDANAITATATRTDGSPVPTGTVRFRIDGPNAGSGAVTTNSAGQATITWDGVRDGRDTLTAFVDTNGDGAASPGEPTATATVDWVLPVPEIRKTVNIEPVSGRVTVKLPANAKVAKKDAWAQAAQNRFIPLEEAKHVPVGTIVNAIRGRVELASAARLGTTRTNTGQFYSGQFQIIQGRGRQPYTELRMNEGLICPPSRSSNRVDASRARTRRLWGNGRGRFRTRGRHSSASVRGTIWYSKDDCRKTTTVVREGTVVVNDFGKRRNVTLRQGDRYVARARNRR